MLNTGCIHIAETSIPDACLMTVKDDVISFKQDILFIYSTQRTPSLNIIITVYNIRELTFTLCLTM
jgi:hypothetical protein